MKYKIKKISNLKIQSLKNLADEAKNEGYNYVRKTMDEWLQGINQFSKQSEVLWGVFDSEKCIAIGGLNIDPFADEPAIGRVRRIYVSKKYRQKGIATYLLKKIIEQSKPFFSTLRLSTNNQNAAELYESMGFIKAEGVKQTHILSNPG